MTHNKWVTPAIWICGYGFGILTSASYVEEPRYSILLYMFGFFLAGSGVFWYECQRSGGLIDRITEKIMKKKYGEAYDKQSTRH